MDDVDPALYDGDPADGKFVEREQDDFEIELLRRAERRGLPVLALCRGAQLMAVAYGGKLRRLNETQASCHGLSLHSLSAHAVRTEPGSTALTRMPCSAPSTAAARVNPHTACLEAM